MTNINNNEGLVFIGDLHGQEAKLDALLNVLGLSNTKLVFIGDLIDNAPDASTDHVALLTRVKKLVDEGKAYCIMGNHEFNAIGWATKCSESGEWLRQHSVNNTKQHQGFLDDVVEDSETHHYWINWFKTLPLYLDFGIIRAIHACWQQTAIDELGQYTQNNNQLQSGSWQLAFDKNEPLYRLIEILLKGPELALPTSYSFKDKTGTTRKHIRCKWWLSDAETYRDIAQVQEDVINDIPNIKLDSEKSTEQQAVPVVVGHYTLNGKPHVLSNKVVCVDYNAAKGDSPLVGYYWQGELDFTDENFVYSDVLR